MQERREALGGYHAERDGAEARTSRRRRSTTSRSGLAGSKGRAVSTTMGFVSMLRQLLKDPEIGKLIVPIIPDEGRTFGMESVIRQVGIYASEGQKYKPHDADMLLYYREEKDGQILEEGITEAGSMASFTAAGTAYSNYRVPMIPFYMYYSMFGFQRIGDMVWAFADSRGKGFLMGGTAGRTTMLGEGLQHQDGHSHRARRAPSRPASRYDPAYVYEMAVIMQDGIRRMYEEGEDRLLLHHHVQRGLRHAGDAGGRRRKAFCAASTSLRPAAKGKRAVQLFGSGPILNEALRAQQILAEKYDVAADVWSVTSYNELRRDALAVERWNRLHPAEPEKQPYIVTALGNAAGPIIAATDYMKAVPDQLAPWLRERLVTLGTDGFGRSDNREHLRRHFEVNAESIAAAALSTLARDGKFDAAKAAEGVCGAGRRYGAGRSGASLILYEERKQKAGASRSGLRVSGRVLIAGVEQRRELGVDACGTLGEPLVFGGGEHDGHIPLIVADEDGLLLGFAEQCGQVQPGIGGGNCLHVGSRSISLVGGIGGIPASPGDCL